MLQGIHLQQDLDKAVQDLGFTEFTEIQKKTIPLIQEGKDVIAQSHTGSGKTAAFGFPIIEKTIHGQGIQALILVPTRELCEQVNSEMHKFAKYKRLNILAVYGGVSINPQIDKLNMTDIVVGTPGRILDHIQRKTIILNKVNILVLDEADKMFEMGFIDDVKRIISYLKENRQTLLFSATISSQVHHIVRNYMKNPLMIKVKSYVDEGKLIQHYYNVPGKDKFSLLAHLLKKDTGLTMIFCATRRMVDVLSRNLHHLGIQSGKLHGGLSQNKRKESIDMFHAHKFSILIASDVAARGLDIKNVSHIINYDIPKTSNEYIHRIGRTARAGTEGKVISLLSESDHDNFRRVLEDRSLVVQKLEMPEFEKIPLIKLGRMADEERPRYQSNRSHEHSRSRGPRRFVKKNFRR